MIEIYVPTTLKQLSQRKLEEYTKMSKIVQWGRKNPVKFGEEFFGTKLIDYQAYCFMKTWTARYALWLECRGGGKDTKAAVYNMVRLCLIPDYRLYISSNSYAQSVESFNKLRDIALKRIPTFKSVTDIFAMEVDISNTNSSTGFIQAPTCKFQLYNNSALFALSSNLESIRGKRGAVWFNETAWKTREEIAVVENFANVDQNFSTSTEKVRYEEPENMPLQILYTSSASSIDYPFYDKYKQFFMKMLAGDDDYFCFDVNAYDILNHSSIDGKPIKSHLTEEQISKAIEEDPDSADVELFNRFRKSGGANACVSMNDVLRNSVSSLPTMSGDGEKKYLFFYDPARNFDGSVLSIFEIVFDEKIGYKLKSVHVVSMVDEKSKNKTPLPMPAQLKIIKKLMIDFNGNAPEWENIVFYIDAGAGGGGVSAVADQLIEDWKDEEGKFHRGIIDPEHPAYQTARENYPHAYPIVRLLEPKRYKTIMFDALSKMVRLNLIEFTQYDGKNYILIEKRDKDGNIMCQEVELTDDEKLSLANIEIAKKQITYMCRYDNGNGNVTYELSRDKHGRNDHDDHAYTFAMAGYALATMRREKIVNKTDNSTQEQKAPMYFYSSIDF